MNPLLRQLKERVKKISREKKNDFFYSLCKGEQRILDVGVFPETSRATDVSTNHFLKGFRFPSRFYTGLSIDPVDGMEKLYPGKRFVQYDGGRFPFRDQQFDWAYSNAVIEHVGNRDAQIHFVSEMLRIARNVFFTTPNKFFPVDAHTMVFFLHWNDEAFLKWRAKNNKWMPAEALNLLSENNLADILKAAGADKYRIIRNRFMGLTMTFSVVVAEEDRKLPDRLDQMLEEKRRERNEQFTPIA